MEYTNKPLLSIIIPVYNVENYIGKCIDSCLMQNIDSESYELIIVNDGSTDASDEIIQQYLLVNTNIRYFEQENQGLSGARNAGVDLATGEYIWFVDSDDWIEPYCLKYLLSILEDNNLDILEFDHIYAVEKQNGDYSYSYDSFYNRMRVGDVTSGKKVIESYSYIVSVTNKIIRKSLFTKNNLKFPLNRFSEDNIVSLMLMCQCTRYIKLDKGFYYYYYRVGSITKKKNKIHLFKYIDDQVLNVFDVIKYLENNCLNNTLLYQKVIDNLNFIIQNCLLLCLKNGWFSKFYETVRKLEKIGIKSLNSNYRYSFGRRVFVNIFNIIFS